jgi:N-carbamoyl-L-amino-acid hydrolase
MKKNNGINRKRLLQRLTELAQIGALEGGGEAPPKGGISRLALTDADKRARDLTVSWMKELGLSVQIDQAGNIFGLRPGERELSPVMLGSHIDTVTVAGRYDGSYGVIAALEIIHTLHERDIKTLRPLAVAAFTNEEGVRYSPGMLGSAVYAGDLSVERAQQIEGFDGSIFGEELERIGYAGSLKPGEIRPHAFLELHIEQGPVLDRANLPLGLVEAVTGITWLEITVSGSANHAGTTPIDQRRDAGMAAAKLVTAIREIATTVGGNQRATCGMISFEPNAINVIPGKAVFTVDLRNSDGEALVRAEGLLHTRAQEVEASDYVDISIRDLEHVPPVEFDPGVLNVLEQTAKKLGVPFRRMVSGAGHDAQLMAGMCPTAMIFVPSRDGISHSPDEYSTPEDLETGANVLLHSTLTLANKVEMRSNK